MECWSRLVGPQTLLHPTAISFMRADYLGYPQPLTDLCHRPARCTETSSRPLPHNPFPQAKTAQQPSSTPTRVVAFAIPARVTPGPTLCAELTRIHLWKRMWLGCFVCSEWRVECRSRYDRYILSRSACHVGRNLVCMGTIHKHCGISVPNSQSLAKQSGQFQCTQASQQTSPSLFRYYPLNGTPAISSIQLGTSLCARPSPPPSPPPMMRLRRRPSAQLSRDSHR